MRCGAEYAEAVNRQSEDELGGYTSESVCASPARLAASTMALRMNAPSRPGRYGAHQRAPGDVGSRSKERPGQSCKGRRGARDADEAAQTEVPQPDRVDDNLKRDGHPGRHRHEHRRTHTDLPRRPNRNAADYQRSVSPSTGDAPAGDQRLFQRYLLLAPGWWKPHRRGRRVYFRLSLCGEQLLDLFGELDNEAPPDRRLAPFSPGSIGP